MAGVLLVCCLCTCGGVCVVWRRGGGADTTMRSIRRIFSITCLTSAILIYCYSVLFYSSSIELKEFRNHLVNCSMKIPGEMGVATCHQWYHAVGYTVDDLRVHWAFPEHPNTEGTVSTLRVEYNQKSWKGLGGKYAHRIFGYLLPPVTGEYIFQVKLYRTTARATAEFWLSPFPTPQQSLLVAYTSIYTKEDTQSSFTSKNVFLQSCGLYYFEFLAQSYNGRIIAEVMWKRPQSWIYYSIPTSAIVNGDVNKISQFKNRLLPTIALQRHNKRMFIGDNIQQVSDLKPQILTECEYQSRVAYSHEVKEFWGHKELIWSHVYPTSDTGTKLIPPPFVNKVLKMYTEAFNKSKQSGEVIGIRYMDATDNVRNGYLDKTDKHRSFGTKILLEMDIRQKSGSVIHTSEYVYLKSGSNSLCHTTNFQWKRDVYVYIVVSVKNLGIWLQHLIHNIEHIYKVTKDENFELVIVDYQSEDIDIESELKTSSLPRWKVINMTGGFTRSGGLQAGIDYVTDSDSIVMTIDMHLTLPPGFIEYIRRHVVQGKMGFAPMFFRLNEGSTEVTRAGFWETLTYGLLGMYKSDWINTGGFDTEKYTTKWGGEDWDAVDKIRSTGLELFRIGYPGLVHYYHSKARMWEH